MIDKQLLGKAIIEYYSDGTWQIKPYTTGSERVTASTAQLGTTPKQIVFNINNSVVSEPLELLFITKLLLDIFENTQKLYNKDLLSAIDKAGEVFETRAGKIKTIFGSLLYDGKKVTVDEYLSFIMDYFYSFSSYRGTNYTKLCDCIKETSVALLYSRYPAISQLQKKELEVSIQDTIERYFKIRPNEIVINNKGY